MNAMPLFRLHNIAQASASTVLPDQWTLYYSPLSATGMRDVFKCAELFWQSERSSRPGRQHMATQRIIMRADVMTQIQQAGP